MTCLSQKHPPATLPGWSLSNNEIVLKNNYNAYTAKTENIQFKYKF